MIYKEYMFLSISIFHTCIHSYSIFIIYIVSKRNDGPSGFQYKSYKYFSKICNSSVIWQVVNKIKMLLKDNLKNINSF